MQNSWTGCINLQLATGMCWGIVPSTRCWAQRAEALLIHFLTPAELILFNTSSKLKLISLFSTLSSWLFNIGFSPVSLSLSKCIDFLAAWVCFKTFQGTSKECYNNHQNNVPVRKFTKWTWLDLITEVLELCVPLLLMEHKVFIYFGP